jgi:hypothetical protein
MPKDGQNDVTFYLQQTLEGNHHSPNCLNFSRKRMTSFGTSSTGKREGIIPTFVTGVTVQICRRGRETVSVRAIHFASRARRVVVTDGQRLCPNQHQDPSVWFAHRCEWAIYQPDGSRQDMRRRPQAAGKGYVPPTPAFRPGSRRWDGLQPMPRRVPAAGWCGPSMIHRGFRSRSCGDAVFLPLK